jgi:hypothetical protein
VCNILAVRRILLHKPYFKILMRKTYKKIIVFWFYKTWKGYVGVILTLKTWEIFAVKFQKIYVRFY